MGAAVRAGGSPGLPSGLLRDGDGDGHRLARRPAWLGMRPVALALFWLNVGLYVVLWVLYLARLVLHADRSSPT